jgi:protein SCO1/2
VTDAPTPPRRSIAAPIALGAALVTLMIVTIQRARRPADADPVFGASGPAAERGRVLADYGELHDFELVDSTGRKLSKQSLAGRIWIADFFYTSCPGPCIALTTKMRSLSAALASDPEVLLLSITVDPENDDLTALASYARVNGGDPERWRFVGGQRAAIEGLAKDFLAALGGKDESGMLSHTTRVSVVDRRGHVRAIHDTESDPEWKAAILHSVKLLLEQQPAGG